LWAGVDLRTCQSWMGHKDLESTEPVQSLLTV
jgi:site-specific recombinase XerD